MNLDYYKQQYKNIMRSSESKSMKAFRFARLMEEMEKEFDIPIQNNIQYNNENADVIAFYKLINNSKNT